MKTQATAERAAVASNVAQTTTFGDTEYITANQLHQSRAIKHITTFKTLVRYINSDYEHVFKPLVFNEGRGRRYYIPVENVAEFIRQFNSGELTKVRT